MFTVNKKKIQFNSNYINFNQLQLYIEKQSSRFGSLPPSPSPCLDDLTTGTPVNLYFHFYFLLPAEEFLTVQKEIADIMKDRILVGHALKNDMKVSSASSSHSILS